MVKRFRKVIGDGDWDYLIYGWGIGFAAALISIIISSIYAFSFNDYIKSELMNLGLVIGSILFIVSLTVGIISYITDRKVYWVEIK